MSTVALGGNVFKKLALLWRWIENAASVFSLLLLAALSFAGVLSLSVFKFAIPYSGPLTSHITLFFACFAAMLAGRENKQLNIGLPMPERGFFAWISAALLSFFTQAILWTLFISSLSMVLLSFDYSQKIAFLPLWLFTFLIPLSFLVLAIRSSWRDFRKNPLPSLLAFVAALWASLSTLVNILSLFWMDIPEMVWVLSDASIASLATLAWPLALAIVFAAFCGLPLFLVLSGLALLAFATTGGPLEPVSYQSYPMFTGAFVPALPLFTLAGVLLAESRSGQRLVELVKYAIGWIRGGPAVAAVVVSAFFTTFTGASGVTILALGGLLMLILKESSFKEDRALGLLTSSGAIGILFPPSLAIIVYGSISQVNIMHLFLGGILPGLLLVLSMAIAGIFMHRGHEKMPFQPRKTLFALKEALGEIFLPVFVIAGYFSGFFTLVQTGAFTVVYVFVLVVFVRKDFSLRQFPAAVLKSVPLTGGLLIILASAQALKDYLVDARIPMILADWTAAHIASPFLFLLLLNLALLLTGCIMDLFSAILVVAPLVIPMALNYGIHPVHLGIIFLTNLSLGFLTPPIGMNLFIASYTFDRPLTKIYKSVLPFFLIQLIVLALVTWLPWFTLAFVPK